MALELKDKTANRNDWTTNNGVADSSSVPGSLTGAQFSAEFDASGDYLECPDSASLGITGNLTIEFWVYVGTDTVGDPGITKAINSGQFAWTCYIQGSESPIFGTSGDGSNLGYRYTNNSQSGINTWEHWAFVKATAPSITIYKNGSSVTPLNSIGAALTAGIFDGTDPIRLKSNGNNIVRYTDVRIWSVARSGAEISGNYQALLTGGESNLVANWDFIPFSRGGAPIFMFLN